MEDRPLHCYYKGVEAVENEQGRPYTFFEKV